MNLDNEAIARRSARNVDRALYRRVEGSLLFKLEDPMDVDQYKPPFPIVGCLCVQDTPDNPCPCTDLVMWPLDQPVDVSRTSKKNAEGDEVFSFLFKRSVRVQVQVPVPIELGELERLATLRRRREGKVAYGPTYTPPPGGAPPLGWVSLAGAVGWGIGSVLDDLLGSGEGGNDNLSDDLSDWAAENFPAPDWLQDLL